MKTDRNSVEEENGPAKPAPRKNASKADAGRNRKGNNEQKAAGKTEGRK
jgi:hypothetical protein